MEINVSSPGNIFLLGEHSVVYGKDAIISAINMRTICKVSKRSDDVIKLNSEDYGKFIENIKNLEAVEEYHNRIDLVKDLVSTFYKKFEIDNGIDIRINSNIPKVSGGMSSSTAVLCSVLDALNKSFNKINKNDYFNFLIPFQRKIHGGTASGVELFSSIFGGYNKIKMSPLTFENLGNLKLHILIVDTGIEARTAETVSYVRNGWKNDKNSYENIFNEIHDIVNNGKKAIKENDLEELGKLMLKDHELLSKDLGVSHPKLNKIVKIAKKNGAYGAKLSGGGKGGVAIVLFPKNKEKIIIKKLLSQLKCKIYRTEVGVCGCENIK